VPNLSSPAPASSCHYWFSYQLERWLVADTFGIIKGCFRKKKEMRRQYPDACKFKGTGRG
jgi:hypothetical protein